MAFQDSLWSKYLIVIFVITLYWVVSITLVFINKYLLSGGSHQIDAPLFITCFQCMVTVLLSKALSYVPLFMPACIAFVDMRLEFQALKTVFPLSVIFVAMITFNNLCLKHVGVPFYYIGRSLTTVFNVLMTVTILNQKVAFKALVCCVVIILGFVLGVEEEEVAGSLSVAGVIYGVLASFFVSLYAVHVKKMLVVMDGSIWKLTYYNNLNAILLFIPLILLSEEINVITQFHLFSGTIFLPFMVLGGIFGFAIGYVTSLQIMVTSPLTHNISGTAKACVQTVGAVMLTSETKSILWWISNAFVLLGSAAYTRVQQLEMIKDYEQLQKQKKLEKVSSNENI